MQRHHGAEQGRHEADEAAEDRDRLGDDVREEQARARAREPHGPVLGRRVVQVVRAAQDPDKDELGGEVVVDDGREEESGQRDAV